METIFKKIRWTTMKSHLYFVQVEFWCEGSGGLRVILGETWADSKNPEARIMRATAVPKNTDKEQCDTFLQSTWNSSLLKWALKARHPITMHTAFPKELWWEPKKNTLCYIKIRLDIKVKGTSFHVQTLN